MAVGTFGVVAQHPEFPFHIPVAQGTHNDHSAVTAETGDPAVGTFDILPYHPFVIDWKFFLTVFASHKFFSRRSLYIIYIKNNRF